MAATGFVVTCPDRPAGSFLLYDTLTFCAVPPALRSSYNFIIAPWHVGFR